ncbi:MAG: glycine cleavage system aminomethyltransferase GcvT [Pseudomonadota bacterium]
MSLKTTPLDLLHRELGARMVPFAGYQMPVQYPEGILAEHRFTRSDAGLFDVSHMGQFIVEGPDVTATLESLVPVDLVALGEHQQTYALLTNTEGGVRDDLIITRWGPDRFFLVVNAACKGEDRAWIEAHLSAHQTLTELDDRALLALQGPAARDVLGAMIPAVRALTFMNGVACELDGQEMYVTCSGYTGEDGFELSVANADAVALAQRLIDSPRVQPIGLGARDSLRLEAGLCLYGHELDPTTTPIEARLNWAISKARRPGGEREGGYPGADRVAKDLAQGASRVRIGLQVLGKRPVREGMSLVDGEGRRIGSVTSGGFGATVDAPIAMAYVEPTYAALGTELAVDVRGKALPVEVVKMPVVPQRYFRG